MIRNMNTPNRLKGQQLHQEDKRGRRINAGAQPADEEQEEHHSLIMTLGSIEINYDRVLQ